MITRSFSHDSDRKTGTAASLAQGQSLSLPHPSSVSSHPKANMATPSVSVFTCFDAMSDPAIAAPGLNTDRMAVAAADRGLIAGVQRP
jgi:hypothetical protein